MVIIACAFVCSAIWQALEQIAEDKTLSFFEDVFVASFFEILCSLPSTSLIIFRMVSITFVGCFPTDVSALSIIASAPSITEFATSFTSALVAEIFSVILSSICVAITTGLDWAIHFSTINFW